MIATSRVIFLVITIWGGQIAFSNPIPVTIKPVKNALREFVPRNEEDPIYSVFNIHTLKEGNAEYEPECVVVKDTVSLNLIFRNGYGRNNEKNFVGSLKYILYTPPQEKGNALPYITLSPVLTKNFAFNWDTTQTPDGTYVLSVKYIDGNKLESMRVRILQVVIDNDNSGPVPGAKKVPIGTFYYDGDTAPPTLPDWVTFSGVRRPSRIHPYPYQPSPSLNGDNHFLNDASKWFAESLIHSIGRTYEDIRGFATTKDGHVISEGFYAQEAADAEGTLERHNRHPYWCLSRGRSTISPYSTFVPFPGSNPGWFGIDISGRVFYLTERGHVTTIAGYVTRDQDQIVPHDRRVESISLSQRRSDQARIVGNFTDSDGKWVFFNKTTDLTPDLSNPDIFYVADAGNHRIAKLDFTSVPIGQGVEQGDPTVTTYAGVPGAKGHHDGPRNQALFNDPYSIDMDSHGNIYVADRMNSAIRKISSDGSVTTVAGGPNGPSVPNQEEIKGSEKIGLRDKLIATAPFSKATVAYPSTVRVDSKDNVIIAEDWTRSVRRANFQTNKIELIGLLPDRHWGTWIWMDVDVNGTIGAKDDVLVAISESLGEDVRTGIVHHNTQVIQLSQTGAYEPYQILKPQVWGAISNRFSGYQGKVLEPTTHYPWAIAVDDKESRFLVTGFGTSGIMAVRSLLPGDPKGYDHKRYVTGQYIYSKGSTNTFPEGLRPAFSEMHGARGFNTFGDSVLNFDDMALLLENVTPIDPDGTPDERAFNSNLDIANFLRNGSDGMFFRPELTGEDLVNLIYFIRLTSVEGEIREIDITEIQQELQAAGLHKLQDSQGPDILNVQMGNLGDGKVLLTWDTNEPTLGLIEYGPTSKYGLTSNLESGYETEHSMVISDLILNGISNGNYHFSIYAKDIAGNTVQTNDIPFTFVNNNNEPLSPVANITASPVIGNVLLTAQFDGSSSMDFDGNIVSYSWDFGDGSTATGMAVEHTYKSTGTYTAKLIVKDDAGNTSTATKVIKVISSITSPPIAKFTANKTLGEAPMSVNFDASSSSAGRRGSMTAYSWDFGDGSIGHGITAKHTYLNAGKFSTKLTIMDNNGIQTSISKIIIVQDPVNFAPDADDDRMDDRWELTNFGSMSSLPHTDEDGDGFSNFQEFRNGSDPLTYAVPLTHGWNLLSLSSIPDHSAVDQIFPGMNLHPTAWTYSISGRMERARTLSDSHSAYWVFHKGDTGMGEIHGTLQINDQVSLYPISLKSGWNLMSVYRVPDDNSVTSIFDGIDIDLPVWKWHKDRFVVAEKLEPLSGYWVYLNDEGATVQIDIPMQ